MFVCCLEIIKIALVSQTGMPFEGLETECATSVSDVVGYPQECQFAFPLISS